MIHAFVCTRVDYCNSLLIGLPKAQLAFVQSVLNAVARLIAPLRTLCLLLSPTSLSLSIWASCSLIGYFSIPAPGFCCRGSLTLERHSCSLQSRAWFFKHYHQHLCAVWTLLLTGLSLWKHLWIASCEWRFTNDHIRYDKTIIFKVIIPDWYSGWIFLFNVQGGYTRLIF